MNLDNPTILVIVGVSGDLASKKILPALYQLERDNLISKLSIVGTARRELDINSLRGKVIKRAEDVEGNVDEDALNRLFSKLEVMQFDPSTEEGANELSKKLSSLEKNIGVCATRLFHLAIPSSAFDDVAIKIGQHSLDKCNHSSPGRLLVEKPFGNDLESAKELDNLLKPYFSEEQIYRIDHFLAKETAQNLVYFRFMNPIVSDLFSSKFIDHVQITVAEDLDIEGRSDFYEQTGAVKDVLQSHLLQLLSLITMRNPKMTFKQGIREARQTALDSVETVEVENVVLGQYDGYKDEVNNPKSQVETFVALKLNILTETWADTPVYMRTGKALKEGFNEINIVYKAPKQGSDNVLTFRIQPSEGIAIKLSAKKPGLLEEGQEVVMDYCYERSGHEIRHDAYQKLLIDAMNSNQTLFPSSGEVEASWRILEPLVRAIHNGESLTHSYAKGSWGPQASFDLIERDERQWVEHSHPICRVPLPQDS